eukprot:6286683-Pyramimonas_sp.AAC.1
MRPQAHGGPRGSLPRAAALVRAAPVPHHLRAQPYLRCVLHVGPERPGDLVVHVYPHAHRVRPVGGVPAQPG